jgi:hypothetical protein
MNRTSTLTGYRHYCKARVSGYAWVGYSPGMRLSKPCKIARVPVETEAGLRRGVARGKRKKMITAMTVPYKQKNQPELFMTPGKALNALRTLGKRTNARMGISSEEPFAIPRRQICHRTHEPTCQRANEPTNAVNPSLSDRQGGEGQQAHQHGLRRCVKELPKSKAAHESRSSPQVYLSLKAHGSRCGS